MDVALCTIDSETYSSIEFAALKPAQIERLRQGLVCKECDGPAYYRKASKDGKKACFGADHGHQCMQQVDGGSHSTNKAVTVLVNRILVANNLISIDFNANRKDKTGKVSVPTAASDPAPGSGASKRHDLEPGTNKISKLKISSILRLLVASLRFSKSDILVSTGSAYPFKAKNLFINCKYVDLDWLTSMQQQNRNTWRGFWGIVRTCTAAWITVADVLIRTDNLNEDTLTKFKNEKGDIGYDDVIGCRVLIFGTLKKSTSDKLYVVADASTAVVFLK